LLDKAISLLPVFLANLESTWYDHEFLEHGVDVRRQALNTMTRAVSLYGSDKSIRKAFDTAHKKLECCGGKNYTDWYFAPWTDDVSVSTRINVGIPESCCDRSNASAQHIKCTTTVPRKHLSKMTPYLSGCAETFAHLYR